MIMASQLCIFLLLKHEKKLNKNCDKGNNNDWRERRLKSERHLTFQWDCLHCVMVWHHYSIPERFNKIIISSYWIAPKENNKIPDDFFARLSFKSEFKANWQRQRKKRLHAEKFSELKCPLISWTFMLLLLNRENSHKSILFFFVRSEIQIGILMQRRNV